MPIYEYRCQDCSQLSSLFVRSLRSSFEPRCEHCGSALMERKMSAVARLKTDADVQAQYGTPGIDGRPEDGYRDPRQIGRWVERRFQEYGMEVPPETRELIDAAREGELPGPLEDL